MRKTNSQRKPAPDGPTSNQLKGRIVEQLIAIMHDAPGVTVEKNVFLSPRYRGGPKRQFDVVLTANVAGYPHRIAIECKNEGSPIGVERIDAFVGKLQDVGITQGVYVSVMGYTQGAAKRAALAGIRPLILTGLTADGLAQEVEVALQSVIHLLLVVKNVTVHTERYFLEQPQELLSFYDSDGNYCGSIYDLVYMAWLRGKPPSIIGSYAYRVAVPSDWHLVIEGTVQAPLDATVQLAILGLVVSIKGIVHTHQLVHAVSADVERVHLGASFDAARERWPAVIVNSEAELAAVLQTESSFRLTLGRIRSPRILYNGRFWPISARAMKAMEDLDSKGKVPNAGDAIAELMRSLEGTDLHSAWERIWPPHQAIVEHGMALLPGTEFLIVEALPKP